MALPGGGRETHRICIGPRPSDYNRHMSAQDVTAGERPTRPLNDPGLFVAVAVVGIGAVVFLLVSMFRTLPVPAIISQDYTRVAGHVIASETSTNDPRAIETALAARQPGLGARVPDLQPAGFVPFGAAVHAVDGQPGILVMFHNRLEDLVVWQVYQGQLSDLPATTDVRVERGRRYVVHRKSSFVLVFWQDGPRVQVITSSLPAEQVVQLAFSAG